MFSNIFLISCIFCIIVNYDKVCCSDSTPRGAEIRLTKSCLRYGASIGISKLQRDLRNKRLPNFNGRVGPATWNAENLKINHMNIGHYSVTPIANMGVRVSTSGISVRASGRVRYSVRVGWFPIGHTINVQVDASNIKFRLDVKLNAQGGKPVLRANGCSASIGHLNLNFHGGLAWVYNLFKGVLANFLKNPITQAVCSEGQKIANIKANEFLRNFQVKMKIANLLVLDYSFKQTQATSQYLDLLLRGEFLDARNPRSSGVQPKAFSTVNSSSRMVYIWLSEYTINSAGIALYNAGRFKETIDINNKLIPADAKPLLNTLIFKDLVPKLYEAHPDRPIRLKIETLKAPTVTMETNKILAQVQKKISIEVMSEDGKVVPAFYIQCNIKGHGKAKLFTQHSAVYVGGRIDAFTWTGQLGGSIFGDIDIPMNNKLITDIVQAFVINTANPILDKGFPIPRIPGLRLINPKLTVVKNAIRVETDIRYG